MSPGNFALMLSSTSLGTNPTANLANVAGSSTARRSATLRGDLDQFAFWVPSLLAVDIDQDDAIALDAIAALFNNAAIESLGSFKGFCSSQNLPSDG